MACCCPCLPRNTSDSMHLSIPRHLQVGGYGAGLKFEPSCTICQLTLGPFLPAAADKARAKPKQITCAERLQIYMRKSMLRCQEDIVLAIRHSARSFVLWAKPFFWAWVAVYLPTACDVKQGLQCIKNADTLHTTTKSFAGMTGLDCVRAAGKRHAKPQTCFAGAWGH